MFMMPCFIFMNGILSHVEVKLDGQIKLVRLTEEHVPSLACEIQQCWIPGKAYSVTKRSVV